MSNFIGVDKLYYAIETKDDSTGVTYGTPKPIPNSVKISVEPATGRSTFYADNQPREQAQTLGETKISLETGTMPLSIQAELLGHTITNGKMTRNVGDKAPNVCIMYRRQKANGKFRFKKLFKCLFGWAKDDAETEQGTPKFQTDALEGSAIPRIFDGKLDDTADEEEQGYQDVSGTWFASVEPTV